MKLFENTCEFEYPWEQVTAANWRKYPNEMSTHVVAVDVLRRELDASNTVLTTERLITCQQSIPSWIQCLVGGRNVSYVREVSTVDLSTRTLTLRSVNLTMANLLRVYEVVTYTPHATDSHRTVFTQEARITAYAAFSRVCSKIEEWSVQRFGENAKKGKQGFESVLRIFNEQWERKEQLVDDLSHELSESLDKVVKTVDENLDKVAKTVDENLDKVVKTVDEVKLEISKETDKLIKEAEVVKKSILTEYYDVIKNAFKRD